MPRALRNGLLLAVAAALALAMPLKAQGNTGNIYGTVTDEQGSPVPGGVATLTGPYAPQTATVDAAGQFRFLKVPPNTFTIIVTMPGFTTVKREGIIVQLAKDTNVDIKLKISSVQENVVVSGETPLIDTRRVSTGATFGQAELAEIPTARDIYSLIQQVPGVQLDNVNVAGNNSATAGGPDTSSKGSGNISYLIDGSTVTDNSYGNPFGHQSGGTNTFFDYDTFQNVEITTGGSLLDLANPGVQINVVTKRGTNELKGSARYYYASSNWEANNQTQEAKDIGFTTNSIRFIREYGGELGGPLVKDKLWLWGAGSRQDISVNTIAPTAEDQAFPNTVTLSPWSAKLNWQIAAPNSLNLYYNRSNRVEDNAGASVSRTPPTLLHFTIPTNLYKIEDNQVFSSSLFASIFLNYQSTVYTQIPNGGLDVQEDYYDFQYHGSYPYFYAKDPQKQANLQVSKFFTTGNLNHELKATFNYRQQIADSATGLPGDQLYGLEYTSSAYAAVTGGVRTTYRTEFYTGTIGDTITAGNWTVNAGVRYDYQRGTNLPGYRLANNVVPGAEIPFANFTGNQGYPFTYKNAQPRASVSYALGEKKNTILRASFARYVDQLGYIVYQMSGVPQTSGIYYDWHDANGDHIVQPGEVDVNGPFGGFYGVDPSTAPTPPNALSPNFKAPTTNELTGGIDQQITDDFAVSATYTYRKQSNLQYQTPIGTNASTYELIGNAQGTATAANGFVLNFNEPYYGLTVDSPPSGKFIFNRPDYNQSYDGIEFSAVKRLSHNWMFRAAFGWQSNLQHLTSAGAIYNPNNLWGEVTGQNDNGGKVVGFSSKEYVFISADWQFNVTGMYQFPLGFNLSANLFGRQGYPNPYYVRTVTHDVAASKPNILIGKVGDYRLDNVYQLDLRLEKSFKVGEVNIIPTAEVFNVLNAGTVLQRYQRVGEYDGGDFTPNPKFNTIQETQSPCILRLGLRVNF